LKIAGEWVRREKLGNVDFVRGTMTHLPFTANFFDAVISVSVLHHAVKRKIINVV